MLRKISAHLKDVLSNFSNDDSILFQNKIFPIDESHFSMIQKGDEEKTITFIDGGQAEIVNTGNLCISFVRIAAVTFLGIVKKEVSIHEFYVVTHSKMSNGTIEYVSKIFPLKGESIVNEQDLCISSEHNSIKTSNARAPIGKIVNMARRFAEINFAKKLSQDSDFVLLDGTLEPTFMNEEKVINQLSHSVCALAKTCTLMTKNGNNPSVLFSKIGPIGNWQYTLNEKTHFVKLHEKSKHIFRFEGNSEILKNLLSHCSDSLFVGYPYGLVFADRIARISNKERDTLRMKFVLNKENADIAAYLHATNAHDILDSIG